MIERGVKPWIPARTMVFSCLFLLVFGGVHSSSLLAAGLSEQKTLISGTALAADGGPLQGVVVIEVGRLYGKDFRYGGKTDELGRFSIEVPKGGDYGLHLYASGYIYFPIGVEVKTGQDNQFRLTAPPNPAAEEAPVISRVQFSPDSENPPQVLISLTVDDPNENLSHQVLGINIRTQEGLRLRPSKMVFPWTRDYPNGTYSFSYANQQETFDPADWLFVAADNRCYTSAVLGQPFTADGVLAAKNAELAVLSDSAELTPAPADEQASRELGKQVYAENCAVCHYADKTITRVGPGLKGLFKRSLTPIEKIPVTIENIRRRIQQGGENMPPYGHIKEPKLSALLSYLQSL